jgi:hypothetical protein
MTTAASAGAEQQRLREEDVSGAGWRRWGPYVRMLYKYPQRWRAGEELP